MRLLSLQPFGLAPTRAILLPLLSLAVAAPSMAQDVVPALATAAGAATAATGAAGTTGDWATYKGDAQRTSARNIALPLPLNLVWRHSAAVEAGTSTAPLVIGSGAARRIYFAAGPTVFCIEGETGATAWKSQVLTRPVTAPLLFVPNAPNGAMIVAVTSGGQIAALNVRDGGQVWTAEARAPIALAAPTLARTPNGDRLILCLATGRLIAYTLEGTLDPQWRVDALNPQIRVSPSATPALSADGSRLFVPAQDQRLYSIDVARAKVDYSIQLPAASTSSPLILGEQVVVSSGEIVTGYRLRTGDPIWRFNMGGRQVSASPAGLMDAQGRPVIYIGSPNGTFYAIEGVKGTVLWKRELGESVTGTASITNNAVVVGTSRGVIFALNPLDGAVVWQYRLRTERNPAAPVVNTRRGRGGGNTPAFGGGGESFGGGPGFGGAGVPDGGGQGFPEGGAPEGGGFPEGGFPEGGFPNAGFEGGGGEDGGGETERGRFGRGRFGRGQEVLQTYGVSAPPVIVDGQAYIMGDNVAVYCFDTQAFDAAPPRVIEPSVSVPSAEGALATLEIQGARAPLVPGKAPMYFAAQIDDTGSGLDPSSVQVQWNDAPLPGANVSYSAGTSVLTVTLNQKDAAGLATNLADGTYTLKLTGRDYAGNPLNYTGRIRVDNTTPPPTQNQGQNQRRRRGRRGGNRGGQGNQGNNGGGNFEGGGFPEGGAPGGGFPGGGFPGGGGQGP